MRTGDYLSHKRVSGTRTVCSAVVEEQVIYFLYSRKMKTVVTVLRKEHLPTYGVHPREELA
uniref:Uncharacterized protein n=1 Tax=viral metagenome TaxID=1070528 RepID=A0A6H1ZQ15_9ZZZZ